MTLDSSDIFGAVLVVAILLIVLSVPSIILTVRSSSKLLKRYRVFRSAAPEDMGGMEIPRIILDEWSAVSTPLGYVTMLTDEMERLGSVRPAILQAEIAMILIIILAFVPGYTTDVLICMVAILIATTVSILYWYRNLNNYGRDYYSVMSELESNGDDAEDMIYG